MSARTCPHCGATRGEGPTCSVCELPYEAQSTPPSRTEEGRASQTDDARTSPVDRIPTAPTFVGALWQSGRLAMIVAAVAFGVGAMVPFAYLTSQLIPGSPAIPVTLAEMGLQLGPLAREVRAPTALAVLFSSVVLLQFLFSRTSGRAMRASRPMLYVLSLLPLVSLGTAWMRLRRAARFEVAPGPAAVLVLLGAGLGLVAALRFGTGVPDKPPRSARTDDDEDDDRA
jgi:hypothetical protein